MSKEAGTPIFEVWKQYESIAMHFNDLLIKLRIQALGGIAAIATIVAIISKASGTEFNWEIMAGVFCFLNIFWIAIWILDFTYYNRLLLGAVSALLKIEKLSKTGITHITDLELSQEIENAIALEKKCCCRSARDKSLSFGRDWFYRIIFLGLLVGLFTSVYNLY